MHDPGAKRLDFRRAGPSGPAVGSPRAPMAAGICHLTG